MKKKHIVAGSAGFIRPSPARAEVGAVMRYMLDLTGQKRPKLCLLATAGGDDPAWMRVFYDACSGQNVEPGHLQLFPMPNHPDIEDYILGQDAIWVGGGSVVNLLAVGRRLTCTEFFAVLGKQGSFLEVSVLVPFVGAQAEQLTRTARSYGQS